MVWVDGQYTECFSCEIGKNTYPTTIVAIKVNVFQDKDVCVYIYILLSGSNMPNTLVILAGVIHESKSSYSAFWLFFIVFE